MDIDWDTAEEKVLTYFIFSVNTIALVANIVFAAYKLTPKDQI